MSSLAKQQNCDICGCTPDEIYDAPTHNGRWAWMCKLCWRKNAKTWKLGTGTGQKFVNKDGGEKLAG